MKKTSVIFFLIFSINISLCQKKYNFVISTYSFQHLEETNSNSKIKLVQSFIFDNLKYTVKSNNSLYLLTSSSIELNSDNIHSNNVGPSTIYQDFNKKYLIIDSDTTKLLKFLKVDFENIRKDTVINNYKCHTFISKNNDTLFTSSSLPFYVNPFLLTSNDIKYGVVKAILKQSGIYTLISKKKKLGLPFSESIFGKNKRIEEARNIFFSF